MKSREDEATAAARAQPRDASSVRKLREPRPVNARLAAVQPQTTSNVSRPSETAARVRTSRLGSAELRTASGAPDSEITAQRPSSEGNCAASSPTIWAKPVARARQISTSRTAASSPEPVANVPTAIPCGRVTTALLKRAGSRHSQISAESPVGEIRRMLPTRIKAPCSNNGAGVSYSSSAKLVGPWYMRCKVILRSSASSHYGLRRWSRYPRRATVTLRTALGFRSSALKPSAPTSRSARRRQAMRWKNWPRS